MLTRHYELGIHESRHSELDIHELGTRELGIMLLSLYNIGLLRYRDLKIRVCDKDSIPLTIE